MLSPQAQKVLSPFVSLKEFDGGEAILAKLREAGDVEVEFDTTGRQLLLLGNDMWRKYRSMWFDALRAALDQRERAEAA